MRSEHEKCCFDDFVGRFFNEYVASEVNIQTFHVQFEIHEMVHIVAAV
jgi:hypothetical protein